ncbi:DUF1828 domain-containing protein [Castellaniella sp. MT123]|uniref:DUF1828 domain-containing protein n=1 Tax=Castellaniella sp. MT123 TaxID=3140381 RepID=UPI0031F41AB0
MTCQHLPDLLGYACHSLNENGSLALIETAFTFNDGEGLPVFIERSGQQIRFFDDNETVFHFLGRGLGDDEGKMNTRFIRNAIEPFGLTLNDQNVIEIWANEGDSKAAFAKYISGLLAVAQRERESEGTSPDISLFVEDVAMHLIAWKGRDRVTTAPHFTGMSKTEYALDFMMEGEAVIAINPHPISVGSALKKMVDIAGAQPNIKFRVIIEDRNDPKAAETEGIILTSMATVMPMTRLIKVSHATETVN